MNVLMNDDRSTWRQAHSDDRDSYLGRAYQGAG